MSNGWHQGLCNCCGDISLCLCGLCCWPCLICSNARGLGKSGLIYNILGCFLPCLPVFLLRQNAREKYGIEGGDVEDVVSSDSLQISTHWPCLVQVVSWCCPCCTAVQTAVEIQEQEGKEPAKKMECT